MKLVMGMLALLSSNVFAQNLMTVEKHSGFVPAQYRYSLECAIDAEYTRIESIRGESSTQDSDYKKTVYTHEVPSAKAALTLIKETAKGKMLTKFGPTDGPTATYVGIIEGLVVSRYINLLKTGSTIRQNSKTSAVTALREFADANCAD